MDLKWHSTAPCCVYDYITAARVLVGMLARRERGGKTRLNLGQFSTDRIAMFLHFFFLKREA